MGFDDYARTLSFEKDPLKLKFIIVENEDYPRFYEDEYGFTVRLPLPEFDEEIITYLGYRFPESTEGRKQVAQLFRASVYHLSGHTLNWRDSDYAGWRKGKNAILSEFVVSLIEDLRVNSYVAAWYPDRLRDIGFAGALMLERLRAIDNIRIRATRLMSSLMVYANTGLRRYVSELDRDDIELIFGGLEGYKDAILNSIVDEEMDITPQKMEATNYIYNALLEHGPIVEAPSPPFGESLGPSSLFPGMSVRPSASFDALQSECIEGLGGTPNLDGQQQSWMKAAEAEALMAFDSHFFAKTKEKKILSRFEESVVFSRFGSMGFPNKDYTEYLRAKARCKRSTNKMIEILMSALNEYMEDIRKLYGVLDLSDAVQVVASKSERSDVFIKEEKIKQSFAWAILIDASMSMKNVGDYTRETAIVLAESASKVLLDATSWSIFAFNDRLEIIKEFSEQYNSRVRARLGGLEFRGLTYMPDAVEIAGRALSKRREELKVMMVISDGFPYGYQNIYSAATEVVNELEASDMAVIGIGAQSGRMEYLFNSHCTSYTLKEFVKRFGIRYLEACDNAV